MSNYSNNIMNSIDILTQSALRKLKYDITIKAIVKTIVDVKTGEYKVLYEGNFLSAFAKDDKIAYDINDTVYVKVPEGDFDNKLIIDYKLRGSDLSASEVDELRNSMFEVSDDLLKITDEFGIASGIIKSKTLKIKDKDDTDKNIQIEDLSYYSNKYEYIKLKATFRTQFFKTFVKGNYGLEFIFNGKDTDKYSYKLDSTDFNGNPYYLVNNTEQDIIVQIPTSRIKGLESINLYQKMDKDYYASDSASILAIVNKEESKRSDIEKNNFQYYCERIEYILKTKHEKDNAIVVVKADDIKKDIETNKEKSKYITNQDENAYNIFVKDIKLFFMEKVDLFNLPYYFRVKALQGNDCAGRDLYFNPQLLSNGAEVSSNSTITWYEQDLTVDVASDNYDRAAGVGWKKIQKTVADPNSEAEPCIYNNSLYVPQKSIPQIKRFKVIATYDKSTFDKVIEMVNSKAVNSYSLIYENNKLKVQNAEGKTIAWYYVVGTSTFAKIDNSTDTLSLDNYAKYINVKFYCVVADTILEYDYTNEIVEEITVTYDGDSVFKYDANGDIDVEIAGKEFFLKPIIVFQNGLSDKQYEIKWYDPDGNELVKSDQKHGLKNSMIEQVRLDNNGILKYNIYRKYKQNTYNTFKIKIITADKEYSFEKEIMFLKDGDQGTNGTTYVLIVSPKEEGYQYLQNNGTSSLSMQAKVFKDNNNITEECTITWECSKNLIWDNNSKDVKYNTDVEEDDKLYWIKATAIKNDNSNDFYPISAYYPIDVMFGNVKTEQELNIIIPKYIKYNVSGLNPLCDKDITNKYNKELQLSSLNLNFLTIYSDSSTGKIYLSPTTNIATSSEHFCSIQCNKEKDEKNVIYHTILFYINTIGNEAINGWDGTKLIIDENGKYILTPQIGAGTKNNQNQFTGVIMGYDSGQEKVGLYGYKDGISSFGFKTDGAGYIGAKESGRISFDGNDAIIYGGTSAGAASSMILRLFEKDLITETKITDKNGNKKEVKSYKKAIEIRDSIKDLAFSVDYNGNLFASKADIEGKITANSGTIGGWTIDKDSITSKGSKTILKADGTITTTSLNAKEGCKIGPWQLDKEGLKVATESGALEYSNGTFLTPREVGSEQFSIYGGQEGKYTQYGNIASYSEGIQIGASDVGTYGVVKLSGKKLDISEFEDYTGFPAARFG